MQSVYWIDENEIRKRVNFRSDTIKKKKKHKHIEETEPKKKFELNGNINDTFDEDMKKN